MTGAFQKRVIDLLAMSRFANLPTVWSNVLLAALLSHWENHLCWGELVLICVPISFLYLGGCFLNDWHDVAFDQKTRPDRPIPSGRWKRSTILGLSLTLMFSGVGWMFFWGSQAGMGGLLILLCIFLYTRWHKVRPVSLLFMAGARLLIYPTVAFALSDSLPNIVLMAALAMGAYILGISMTARGESRSKETARTAIIPGIICLLLPVAIDSMWVVPKLGDNCQRFIPALIFLSLLAFTIVTLLKKRNIGAFVSRALALIPMVDFIILGAMPLFTFGHTQALLLILCPLLSLTAWGLQKIAPAT